MTFYKYSCKIQLYYYRWYSAVITVVTMQKGAAFMFQIDAMSRTPVYEQIISQVEKFILGGILSAGDQLPSVRSLSVNLSVNPNTIQKAYGELDLRGIISTVPGRGCFITEKALEALRANSRKKLLLLEEIVAELWAAGVTRKELDDTIDRATQRIQQK